MYACMHHINEMYVCVSVLYSVMDRLSVQLLEHTLPLRRYIFLCGGMLEFSDGCTWLYFTLVLMIEISSLAAVCHKHV